MLTYWLMYNLRIFFWSGMRETKVLITIFELIITYVHYVCLCYTADQIFAQNYRSECNNKHVHIILEIITNHMTLCAVWLRRFLQSLKILIKCDWWSWELSDPEWSFVGNCARKTEPNVPNRPEVHRHHIFGHISKATDLIGPGVTQFVLLSSFP